MKLKQWILGSAGTLALLHGSTVLAATIDISAHDIGGQVLGQKGPEAGVWIIAETRDLPTKYAKVVVTDDRGRKDAPPQHLASSCKSSRRLHARRQDRDLLDLDTAAAGQ